MRWNSIQLFSRGDKKVYLTLNEKLMKIIEDREEIILFDTENYDLELYKFEKPRIYIWDKKITKISEIKKGNESFHKATLNFQNYAGKTNIRIFDANEEIPLSYKKFMVISEKFALIYDKDTNDIKELINYQELFLESLIKALNHYSNSLSFNIVSPTGAEYIETEKPINELFAYHYLKNNFKEIQDAYEEIIQRPYKKLIETREMKDIWRVDNINPNTLFELIFSNKFLVKSNLSTPLGKKLKYIPMKIRASKKVENFDTLENRFAKYFLNELLNWTDRILRIKEFREDGDVKPERLIKLYSRLSEFTFSKVFQDAGEFQRFPYKSQVIIRREGYREILRLWRTFRSYSPFFEKLKQAIDRRDIPTLYEYWCFFKLIDEINKIIGNEKTPKVKILIKPSGSLMKEKVSAIFANKWKLIYNKKLYPKRASYSVSLRPDYSLYNEKEELLGVFDAKFKLDIIRDRKEFDIESEEMDKNLDIRTWAKLEDIFKMHTYRDALKKTSFAIALYPGDKSMLFNVDGELFEGSLKDIISPSGAIFEGIGYLSMKPR